MSRFRFAAVVVAAAVALTAAPASAQYTSAYGYSFNNPISASLNTMMWDRVNQRMLLKSMLRRHGFTDAQIDKMSSDQMLAALGGGKKAAQEAPKPTAPATKFTPAKKQLLVPALIASLTKDKAQQQALKDVFDAGFQAYEAEAVKEGLDHDVAGAIAYFIGVAYLVYHEGQEPDDDGLTLFARQLQQSMDTPDLKKVASADKQKFYELLVGLATWLIAGWQTAVQTNDDAFKAQLKESAGGVLKGYLKLEPDQVKFTAAGLEVAK